MTEFSLLTTEQALIAEFKPIGMPALYYIIKQYQDSFCAINHISDVITDDPHQDGSATVRDQAALVGLLAIPMTANAALNRFSGLGKKPA